MKGNRRFLRTASLALAVLLALGGCSGGNGPSGTEASSAPAGGSAGGAETSQTEFAGGETVSAQELFAGLEQKYGEKEEKYEYGEPISGVMRNGRLELEVGFDLEASGLERYNQIVDLFWDAALTQEVNFRYEYDGQAKKLVLKPGPDSVGGVYAHALTTEEVRKYSHDTIALFSKDAYEDWGNVGKFYLVQYLDLETGKPLEKPLLRVVTTQGELEAPRVVFRPTESGLAGFHWTPVEGASDYIVFQIAKDPERGFSGGVTPIAMTSETSWRAPAPEFSSYSQVNSDFRRFLYCEDDWVGDRVYDKEGLTEGRAVPDKLKNYWYGVLAVNAEGTSMFSNLYSVEELAPNLPYAEAANISEQNGFTNDCEDIGLAPSHVWVTMCDGTTARKLIEYDVDNARVETNRYINVDAETGEYAGGEDLPVLQVPYTVEGAPFEYVLKVVDYDESTIETDLETLKKRQESLRQRSGATGPENEGGEVEEGAGNGQVREAGVDRITANSALSEYLAACMLGRNELIDLEGLPGSGDPDQILDAMMEAYYQNPLILGLKAYRLNKTATKLKLTYDEDAESAGKKQEELKAKVSQVIGEIITPGMTDLEKELAINQYLCDTIEYDRSALENAEASGFAETDPEFNDSFTAYGALLKGKCVCAGYAGAFKLLADEADLECVVVTGMLEGTLPHAWNKVKLDGAWEVVDSTNNDNEELFNALLNVPGSATRLTLVEDREYALDSVLDQYAPGTEDKNEYYHLNEKFFPVNAIAQELAADLKDDGKATLRTDYELTDGSFQEIAQEVYRLAGDSVSLSGYFWMGVIYLEDVA